MKLLLQDEVSLGPVHRDSKLAHIARGFPPCQRVSIVSLTCLWEKKKNANLQRRSSHYRSSVPDTASHKRACSQCWAWARECHGWCCCCVKERVGRRRDGTGDEECGWQSKAMIAPIPFGKHTANSRGRKIYISRLLHRISQVGGVVGTGRPASLYSIPRLPTAPGALTILRQVITGRTPVND